MAPTFRSSRSGRQFVDNSVNRNRQGQLDHDVFEGLPVRRWSRQRYNFSQDPKMDVPDSSSDVPGAKQHFPELPMSKDSNLLSPMSRALLRAARAGCIYIRHVNKEGEEDDKEPAETGETAVTTRVERSFTARKWSVVPKHMEPPEVEFLAKRRPGLPSLYGASGTLNTASTNVVNPSPAMRKTKIKKVDPTTGNVSIYEVWVPEGHKLEGEIDDTAEALPEQKDFTVKKQPPAPGTVVEGVGVVDAEGDVVASAGANATESAIKPQGPPPPKRKGRKIGRGRKKRVMFAPGEGADAATVHGTDGAADERMPIDEEFEEDEDEEDEEGEGEEGEEDDEDTKEEAAALETKSPGIAPQDPSTAPTTEQPTSSTEPSAENQHSPSDSEPSSIAAHPQEEPAPEVPQAPSQELSDSTGVQAVITPAQDATRASSTEKSQTPQELPQSKPTSPTISTTVPGSVSSPTDYQNVDASKKEAPEDISDNIQVSQATEPVTETTEPVATSAAIPMIDAMEGVEQTNQARDPDVSEQAPVLGKTEDPEVVEQTETVEMLEVVQTAEDLPPAPASVTTAEEVASAPAVPEAVSEKAPENAAEGSIDLLGTLEASLGEEKETVSAEQGETTGSPSAEEEDHPETTTAVPPPPSESTSISAPAVSPAPTPTPDISAEVKAERTDTDTSEPQLQPQPEPVSEAVPGPVPEATENVPNEEKKDESEV